LAQRAERLKQAPRQPAVLTGTHPETVHHILTQVVGQAADDSPDGFLPQEAVNAMLAAYGILVPVVRLAQDAEEAVCFARESGFPVVLKLASPDITHKSDVGGVLLNLADETAVSHGFNALMENARHAHPEARLLGVHVQRMIPDGQEVIVGAVHDPQFGPVVMFGSGGVEVEGLKDVDFALAPLTEAEAEELLQNTWAGRKLHGYRHIPPADRTAVFDVILRLGQLAADFPQLAEIEINPLRVLPAGQGAFAVDARARRARVTADG
jgi:acyl-CoA synthetase (NDP forming)